MLEQVSSIISGGEENGEGEVKAAGYYDSEGNYTSWDALVSSGKITLDQNDTTIIINSDKTMTGELVIPDSVTSIGAGAFSNTNITKVIFGENSQLRSIGIEAFFQSTSLINIELPSSLTKIENNIFENIYTLTEITYKGSIEQWNEIELDDDWDYLYMVEEDDSAYIERITKVICSDGVINL